MAATGLLLVSVIWLGTGRTATAALGVQAVIAVNLAVLFKARQALRRGRMKHALVIVCANTAFGGLGVTALVPKVSPAALLIVLLPVGLALPFYTARQLDRVCRFATAMATSVVLLAVPSGGVLGADPVPTWILVIVGPTCAIAIGCLVLFVHAGARGSIEAATIALETRLVELVATMDASRRRIERDLHDGAQQQLAALAIQLNVVEKLAHDPARLARALPRIAQLVADARTDLLRLVDGSFSATVQATGLRPALERAAVIAGSSVTVDIEGVDELPGSVALAVYFSCSEAIQNAIKHAGPNARTLVRVRMAGVTGRARVEFSVADDGIGATSEAIESGHGFVSSRRRMEGMSGTLAVHTAPGRGTKVCGSLPLI